MRRSRCTIGFCEWAVMLIAIAALSGCTTRTRPLAPPIEDYLPPGFLGADAQSKVAGMPEFVRLLKGDPLTLEECIAVALEKNPLRKAALEEVRARRASVGETASEYYPELSTYSSYSRWQRPAVFFRPEMGSELLLADRIGPLDDFIGGFRTRYTLFDGGARVARRRAALAQLEASKHDAERVQQDISLTMHEVFYGLAAAEEIETVAEENIRRSESHLKLAEERVKVGAAPKADILKARVELAKARLSLVNAQSLVRIARGQLNTAMVLPIDFPIWIAKGDSAVADSDQIDLAKAFEDAFRSRPVLRAALQRIVASSTGVQIARSAFLPKIAAEASYGARDTDFPPGEKDWLAGVALEFPIFTGFLRMHRLERAEAELSKAEEETRHLAQKVQLEVWSSYSKLQEAEKAVDATKALVQDSRESLRVAEERYSQGAGTFLDLLDAQVTLAQAEAKLVQTTFDHHTAYAAFQSATGRLR